jgi:acetolactate synthase-1/3 small subunit
VQRDQRVVAQIVNQLNKLVDVIRVADLSWDDCLESELMLVKITAPAGGRDALDTVCRVFHARVSDLGKAGFIVEAAGRGEETDALIQALEPFGIHGSVPHGASCLQRGKSLDVTADLT